MERTISPSELLASNEAIKPNGAVETSEAIPSSRRGSKFWLAFMACLVVDLLSALDLTAVSTALPTIVDELHGKDFIWVGTAYMIASTAILPLVGGLVSSFGRKPLLLIFTSFFAIGSAVCGAAKSMDMLIAGRAIQGIGGGGCISVTEIIYADLVPLPERGKFLGIISMVWAFACAIGPPIGGSLAQSGSWRWLFYLNIPLCGLAFVLVLVFLTVRTPRSGFKKMMATMDWAGLVLIIFGTVAISIALTWGGVKFSWTSKQVLILLCLGVASMLVFLGVEFKLAKTPTISPFVFTNRTTLSGYITTSLHSIVAMGAIFYLPVYFQACKLASPIHSGIDLFGISLVIPVFDKYRPQNYLGWMFIIVGFGLLTMLDENSSQAAYIGYQVILAIGLGIVWIAIQFPVLAPLPISNNAHALAFFTFTRSFSWARSPTFIWGTVIGGAILQNSLADKLPSEVLEALGSNTQLIYAVIPQLHTLTPDLQTKVRIVFADGLRAVWFTMLGISGLGFLTCLSLMKEVKIRKAQDESWGLAEAKGKARDTVTTNRNESESA
ncbi:iron permease [Crucibulum laeve]|uniref:Iron permease n=1 Tax=Crucibulum laeve TaxID=68775 RepID=A0A5C3LIN6_9AGAR|nr:iron permease [Crucibulum laeve]